MVAVDHHGVPIDHHVGDIGCCGGEDDIFHGCTTACGADRTHLHCNEVRSCAHYEFACLSPADGAMTIVGRRPQQAVGGDGAARAGGETFVEFDRAGLFEKIDHGVAVGA